MRGKKLYMSLIRVSLDDIKDVSKVEVVGWDGECKVWQMDTSEGSMILSDWGWLSGRGWGWAEKGLGIVSYGIMVGKVICSVGYEVSITDLCACMH